jgi:hypothetical protein
MKAARIIVAVYSLAILLLHPTLPSLAGWPAVFWKPIPRTLLLRFGYFRLNETLEWILFGMLLLAIVAVMFGVLLRFTAFAAGLLLYHFAPLGAMLAAGDWIGMGGLTVPTIFMFALWAADENDCWPVTLAQLFIALSFLLSGMSKMLYTSWRWYTGPNIRQLALAYWSLSPRPAALWLATHEWAAWCVALGSAALDLLFIFAVFYKPARWVVIPLAIAALIVRSAVFGLHWLAAPLLLLFIVDWRQCAESPWIRSSSRGPAA